MAVIFALTVDAGGDTGMVPVVTADFNEAASEWTNYLNSNATIRVEVDIGTFPSNAGLAIQSDYTTFIPVGVAADGNTLVEPWGMYALPDNTRVTFLGVSSAGQVNYQTG